jgi:hypothetical protein
MFPPFCKYILPIAHELYTQLMLINGSLALPGEGALGASLPVAIRLSLEKADVLVWLLCREVGRC